MPGYICKDCGYKSRDKYGINRHFNRKYPCKSVIVASTDNMDIIQENTDNNDDETITKEENMLWAMIFQSFNLL